MSILTGKAPLRVTFVGGGTDIPSYYEKYGGMTIGCTIDKYVRVSVNSPEIPDITRVKTPWIKEYIDILDTGDEFLIELLEPLRGEYYGKDVCFDSDLNAFGAGLGSSHAMSVAFFRSIYTESDSATISKLACMVEIAGLGAGTGKQDGYTIAYGGCHRFIYTKDRVKAKKLKLPDSSKFLLFDTRLRRRASDILSKGRNVAPDLLSVSVGDIVREFIISLESNDYEWIGHLLSGSWSWKKTRNPKSTNNMIDNLYDTAMDLGAWGGKLLGAGGGGHLFFTASVVKQKGIINALTEKGAVHIPFQFSEG